MIRRFTGWHMATILVIFFGIVVTVNLVMARYAVGTFGGTVVDNSYVASQNYNRWLATADTQRKLGWATNISLDPTRRVLVQASKLGIPIKGLTVTGIATHPLGRAAPIPLLFEAVGNGGYLGNAALPTGRWNVALVLKSGPDTVNMVERIP